MAARRVGAVALAAVMAAAGPAVAAKASGGGQSGGGSNGGTTTQSQTFTAPYQGAVSQKDGYSGLTADKSTGRIQAQMYPALGCCGSIVEDTAFVGSQPASSSWNKVSVTFHITKASATVVNEPTGELAAYLLVGYGGSAQWNDAPMYYPCGQRLFGDGDSPGGTGVAASVVDRTVTITCNAPGYGSVWGGIYLRTASAAPMSLDMTVDSITVS